MIKTTNVNQPLRDMIIHNNIALGTISLLLFYKKENLFRPMPIVFNLEQLPQPFTYFKDLNLLCELIPCRHHYGKGLTRELFYNVCDCTSTKKQGPRISTLLQFIRLDDKHIAIDISCCLNANSEQISELKLGKQAIIHDESAKVSYGYEFAIKPCNERSEHLIHYYQGSIKKNHGKTVSFQLSTL